MWDLVEFLIVSVCIFTLLINALRPSQDVFSGNG